MYCPGQKRHSRKLMMYGINIKYQDVCKDINIVNIANAISHWVVNNSLLVREGARHGNRVGKWSIIPFTYEIINPFLEQYNINVNWIDCNYNHGLYDNETGKWTGVIGQVILWNQLEN